MTRPTNAKDPRDPGVIVFSSAIPDVTPATLPTAGLLGQLGPAGLSQAGFDVVGYGISSAGPRPELGSTGMRMLAGQTFASFTTAWLRLRMDDGAEVCLGDSGAPSLLAGTNTVAGITVGNLSLDGGQCVSQPWDMRVDTEFARAFLGQYVTLP